MDSRPRKIVIVGGGIIGCTTAYFLTRHPKFDPSLHHITLLEASAIAANASGKAGGLLALWAYPACLVPLSFRLHAALAEEHGGAERWGYRANLECGTVYAKVTAEAVKRHRALCKQQPAVAQADATDNQPPVDWKRLPKQDEVAACLLKPSSLPAGLDWIDRSVVKDWEEMRPRDRPDAETETAQVHPFLFTSAMADLARERGVDIRLQAKVTRIETNGAGPLVSTTVEYVDRRKGDDSSVVIDDATDVVVTAGPWTSCLLPRARIEGLCARSAALEVDLSPYVVFTKITLPKDYVPEHRKRKGQKRKDKGVVDPEIYPRPGGETYVCGATDEVATLPDTADAIKVDEDRCDDLVAYTGLISPALAAAPVKARQECFLPVHKSVDGKEQGPLIGQTAVPGVWIAAGHTCWGIQNGPGTGCLMAELLLDGEATSADISSLDPARYNV